MAVTVDCFLGPLPSPPVLVVDREVALLRCTPASSSRSVSFLLVDAGFVRQTSTTSIAINSTASVTLLHMMMYWTVEDRPEDCAAHWIAVAVALAQQVICAHEHTHEGVTVGVSDGVDGPEANGTPPLVDGDSVADTVVAVDISEELEEDCEAGDAAEEDAAGVDPVDVDSLMLGLTLAVTPGALVVLDVGDGLGLAATGDEIGEGPADGDTLAVGVAEGVDAISSDASKYKYFQPPLTLWICKAMRTVRRQAREGNVTCVYVLLRP